MKNNDTLEMMYRTSRFINEVFCIKASTLEEIDITDKCFTFSWKEFDGRTVYYGFFYNDKNELIRIRKGEIDER